VSGFEEVKKEMLKKEDKLGQKIEPGIIDLVTALNCLGFETVSSCEGHPERGGTFYPEVIIMTKKGENDKIQDCWHRNLMMHKNLIKLLQEFYKNRDIEYQHMLITSIISNAGTELRPHSGYLTKILTDKTERNNLHNIYTNEIKDFTDFLKKQL